MIHVRRRAGGALAAAFAAALAVRVFAQLPSPSGYDLYQQALVKERAAGDLDAAIAIYGRIARDFAADRALAAKALLRMAECYDQLRSPEADKLYEQVVAKYSDQKDAAAEAGRRLKLASGEAAAVPTTLKAGPAGLVNRTRQLPVRLLDLTPGALSPDGRWIALLSNLGLGLQDVSTPATATHPLRTLGGTPCDNPIWSRDSRRLAFTSCVDNNQTELRIVDVTGGVSKLLVPGGSADVIPLDWSADGQSILALFESPRPAGTNQLALVSVSTGQVKVVRSGSAAGSPWPLQGMTRLSPDGRYVIYSTADVGKGIRITSTEDGRDDTIPESKFGDRFVGLTPAGRALLFVSDRNGTHDLFLLPFDGGRATGYPVPVIVDIGPIAKVVGLTDRGAVFYTGLAQQPEAVTDLYIVNLDAAGNVTGTAQPVVRRGGGHMTHPVWSADSRDLAYKVTPAGTGGVIYIQTLATGDEQLVATKTPLGALGQFDWSPDRRFLAVSCIRDGVRQIVRVDIQTGDVLVLVAESGQQADTVQRAGQGRFSQPRWMPDGRSILFVDGLQVMRIDAEGGTPRTILTARQAVASFALSLDGQSIAYLDNPGGPLMVASVAAGLPRPIGSSTASGSARRTAWSPDGSFVYLADRTSSVTVPGTSWGYFELWKIPSTGRPPSRAGLTADSIIQPSPSPDGRHLAFSVNTDISPWVHVLENFLPAEQLKSSAKGTVGR